MNRRKIFIFFLIVSSLVFLDLYTKYLVEEKLFLSQEDYVQRLLSNEYDSPSLEAYRRLYQDQQTYYIKEIPLIKDRFSLFYTRNYNVGFSILDFLNDYLNPRQISVFIKLLQSSILVFILIYFFLNKMKLFLPFSLIIAGGIGNNLDRFYRGYVVDFFRVSFPELPWELFNPWPIFNLADVWVSIGGVILFLAIVFKKEAKKKLRDYTPHRRF